MKIIHQNGYSQEELLMYKTTVYKNLQDCAKSIINALRMYRLPLDDAKKDHVEDELHTSKKKKKKREAGEKDQQKQKEEREKETEKAKEKEKENGTALNKTKRTIMPLTEEDFDYIESFNISPNADSVFRS